MVHRIERTAKGDDTRARVRQKNLQQLGFDIDAVHIVDVYTVDGTCNPDQHASLVSLIANPVVETAVVDATLAPQNFNWAIEIGCLPGVTDNVGSTARESIADLLGTKFDSQQGVYSSQITFLQGDSNQEDAQKIAASLANPLIHNILIRPYVRFRRDNGMGTIIPRVTLHPHPAADLVQLCNASESELIIIGKQGIANADGTRRGPLALDLTYMEAIQGHFRELGRDPTDVELESIAQTWSEHCHHTIFADPIDNIQEGLFKHYIRRATETIRAQKAAEGKDFCVSVFKDNSGAIIFDKDHLVTDKAETHNSPSALDPFGGSITGIVGVNRDTIGFGLGAKPFLNGYYFCFGNPGDQRQLYKGANKTQPMLSPARIMDGVIAGVNAGGNCSGIPTPQGGVCFDERYSGKPLVFVRTLGVIPRESAGRLSHEKNANPGDYIVMIGGHVGKDGIHGATFSSESLNEGSPATAVQIGDPITQKKMGDALIREARDLGLYTSITDNGAGGLSCSVAEMAKESGGCYVKLDDVPLKYPGLAPWEIWISESQERMTLSVPPDKWDEFSSLMQRRGANATVIGEFTNSGKCVVDYNGNKVMDLDLEFLHEGLPPRPMTTRYIKPTHLEPTLPVAGNLGDITSSLHAMLARNNIASTAFISEQYDHEVQGGSVLKPLQGRGRVNADATVTKPIPDSAKAVVTSQGINPSYSDIDTYAMAAAAIDTAVRSAVAAGANLEHLAILDNFCWCSSNDPERLGQLKAALRACYDTAVAYGTPFISGKDSMFNDFNGYDQDGNKIKISIPPTLLVSAISVIDDATKSVSLDAKMAGDLIYVLGETYDELGGSEYFAMLGEQEAARGKAYIGNIVPYVAAQRNLELYRALSNAIGQDLIASAQSVGRGGLAVALAKTAMGGQLGMDISLDELTGCTTRNDLALYSESQGRIVVTVAPQDQQHFEQQLQGQAFTQLGVVRADSAFMIHSQNRSVVDTTVDTLLSSYRSTFGDN